MTFDRDDLVFNVVANQEEQYSIWPDYKPLPLGGRKTGFSGLKKDCRAHIDQVWTEVRPKSVREREAITDLGVTRRLDA